MTMATTTPPPALAKPQRPRMLLPRWVSVLLGTPRPEEEPKLPEPRRDQNSLHDGPHCNCHPR